MKYVHSFDLLVQRDEAEIRLAEAALLFATDHHPTLKLKPWLKRLDLLARRVDVLADKDKGGRVEVLRAVLVKEEKFLGNAEGYYDPRNSFLHEVLQRRLGIPITLSTIWLDVCEQLGWPFFGVGLPGHYIIKCDGLDGETLVDPFNGGQILERGDCRRIVSVIQGRDVALSDEAFEPLSKKQTLERMLHNLSAIYVQRECWHGAARVLARRIALVPESPVVRQQLGLVHTHLAQLN